MPLLNNCWFRSGTSALSDFTVASAITGYYTPAQCQNPSAVNGATYSYVASSDDETQHEEGEGVYSSGTEIVARTTVFSSSNAGAKVNFSAAPKVMLTDLAQDFGASSGMSNPFLYGDSEEALEFVSAATGPGENAPVTVNIIGGNLSVAATSSATGMGGGIGFSAGNSGGLNGGGFVSFSSGGGGDSSGGGGNFSMEGGLGGAPDGSGGSYTLTGGDGVGTGGGGGFQIEGGASTGGSGGAVRIFAGTSATATGGVVEIEAGDGDSGGNFNISSGSGLAGNGGSFTIEAGIGNGGNGGDINLAAGTVNAGDGDGGDIVLTLGLGSGTGVQGQLLVVNLPSADPGIPGALYHLSGTVMISL